MQLKIYFNLISLYLISCLLAFSSCKDKQENQPEVVKKIEEKTKHPAESTKSTKKTILCFGNSLTAGYGLDETEAWPSLLQFKLDSLDQPYTVVNAGLSGETTSGGLNRINWVLKQHVVIFILELGANDMLRGLAVQQTKTNLEAIIQAVRNKYPKAAIIMAGMLAPPNMGKSYENKFNKIFPDLSMKYQTSIIPFFLENVAGQKDLNLADGKHPNQTGQKLVLENVWASLEPLL